MSAKLLSKLPALPHGAVYIKFGNEAKRNALGRQELELLRNQLTTALTPKGGAEPLLLPGTRERNQPIWLRDLGAWRKATEGIPRVLVLRSEGPVFCSGHNLAELQTQSSEERKGVFNLCANVMRLIRLSPAPVVCPVQGLATAAGFQLAMATDFPIALADTPFCLPGMKIGLPCTSPATAVSRRVPPSLAYRMFAMGDIVRADELCGAVDVVRVPENADQGRKALEDRVVQVVKRLAVETAPMAQASGKWSFWLQHHYGSQVDHKESQDVLHDATQWAGTVMHSGLATEDAREGVKAFLSKRAPVWPSQQPADLKSSGEG
jgi:enoyl-CoA hydratase/carnithine racemase